MSKLVAPTVGRVVYYTPGEHDNGNNNVRMGGTPDQPMAAIVTFVWNDDMVNLAIMDHDGGTFGKTSVTFVDEDQEAGPGECGWMPYQKEAAAKYVANLGNE